MHHFSIAITLTSLLIPIIGHTADKKDACDVLLGNETLIWRQANLESVKNAINDGDPQFDRALANLTSQADKALMRGPYTVVHKTRIPPSGDPHDYMSMAPYWWPPNGTRTDAPYIRRDGEVNPERDGDGFDRMRLRLFIKDVSALSLAAWFLDDRRYAGHAELLVRVWFVDPATRMNPNLEFAQGVPGRSTGRSFGIIDTVSLTDTVDAIQLLSYAAMIEEEVIAETRRWFASYVRWLTSDEMALTERNARNNHGTHYDAQVMTFASFARNCTMVARILQDTRVRIRMQIRADGLMPEELNRTRSLHYHVFNLHAFLKVARLAEHIGEDLYTYTPESAGSIVKTISKLAVYSGRETRWPYPNMGSGSERYLWRVLRMAATAIESPALTKAIDRSSNQYADDVLLLLSGSIELDDTHKTQGDK